MIFGNEKGRDEYRSLWVVKKNRVYPSGKQPGRLLTDDVLPMLNIV